MSFVIFTKYCQDYQKKETEMGVICRIQGQDKKCLQQFVQKPKEKRVYERPQLRREDNIKMCLKGGLDSFCSEKRQIVDGWDRNI